jgi:hypothetical protein
MCAVRATASRVARRAWAPTAAATVRCGDRRPPSWPTPCRHTCPAARCPTRSATALRSSLARATATAAASATCASARTALRISPTVPRGARAARAATTSRSQPTRSAGRASGTTPVRASISTGCCGRIWARRFVLERSDAHRRRHCRHHRRCRRRRRCFRHVWSIPWPHRLRRDTAP